MTNEASQTALAGEIIVRNLPPHGALSSPAGPVPAVNFPRDRRHCMQNNHQKHPNLHVYVHSRTSPTTIVPTPERKK